MFGSMDSIQGLGLIEALPSSTHELPGRLGLNIQLADEGERRDGIWEVLVSQCWKWDTIGKAETKLEAWRGFAVEDCISQRWGWGKSACIVQLLLSNYFLKIIYKPWDYCCKRHNLFLWLFDLFCWVSSRRRGSIIGGTSMSGGISFQSSLPKRYSFLIW